MPNITNLTVKKADGTTDVTYSAKTASGGDSSPARWSSDTASATPGFRPTFQMKTRDNGPKTARAFDTAYRFPVVRSVNGVDTIVATIPINVNGTVPQMVTTAEASEAVYQGLNLNASALIKECARDGFAPV